MSEIKTLAGMNDDELRESISSACKRHIPNINLPPKYHVIVDALPMIYGEGMVKGYEFAESKFTEELALTKQKLVDSEVALKLALTRAQHDRKDLVAAQQKIKFLDENALSAERAEKNLIGRVATLEQAIRESDEAKRALAKQPDTRALDKALLEAEIAALTHAYDSCKPYGIEFSYMITERIDQLAELNKE